MKILYVSSFLEGLGGGEGNVTWELAHQSAIFGNQAYIFSPGKSYRQRRRESGLIEATFPAKGMRGLMLFNSTPMNIRRLYRNLEKINPDIIHFHSPVPMVVYVQIWALSHNIPMVFTIHEDPNKFLEYSYMSKGNPFLGLIRKGGFDSYLRNLYLNCQTLVAVNDLHIPFIRQFGYNGKLVCVENGRELSKYNKLTIPKVSAKKKILCFIGMISKRKNQKYLIEVMKYLPKEYELRLVGSPIFPSYLKKLPKLRNVKYMGQVKPDKIPNILKECHLFVSASTEEVFSLVCIEALAAGKPIVGLKNSSTRKLINSSNGILLPLNTKPKVFAKTVLSILNVSQRSYEKMATSARSSVSHLDWSKIIVRYQNVYDDILKNKVETNESNRFNQIFAFLQNIVNGQLVESIVVNLGNSFKSSWDKFKNRKKKGNLLGFAIAGAAITGIAITIFSLINMKNKMRKK
ncbi:glycosyltransferase family 4 protein [Candidatus Dojkabacteria bacterium]|jgi:glycosyltransferase involved in cell wall biosynthesis|nr:glycosyltransferase family 4 protein [Candidatus Dojkabacteria bacterium]